MAVKNIAGHDKRQLAGRLYIEVFVIADEGVFGSRGNADPDLAPRLFQFGESGFETPDKHELIESSMNARLRHSPPKRPPPKRPDKPRRGLYIHRVRWEERA